jgi:hypothetical protein
MSAQGLNTTSRNEGVDYRYIPPATNTSPGNPGVGIPRGFYATHFASDHTRRTKEVLLYREYRFGGPNRTRTAPGLSSITAYNNAFVVPVDYRIVQSNQNRKTYQFGEAGCSGCTGGFPSEPLGY